MADEEINVLFSLEDQFTKPMKNVTNRIKGFQMKVKETKKTMSSFGKDTSKAFIKMTKDVSNMGTVLRNSVTKSGADKAMISVLNNQTLALQGFWSTAIQTSGSALNDIQKMSESTISGVGSMLDELLDNAQMVEKATTQIQGSQIFGQAVNGINSESSMAVSAGTGGDLSDRTSALGVEKDVGEEPGMLEKFSNSANSIGETIGSAKNIVEDINDIKNIFKPPEDDSDGGSLVKLTEMLGKSQDLTTSVGGLLGNLQGLRDNITGVSTNAASTGAETASELGNEAATVDVSGSAKSIDTLSAVGDTIGSVKDVIENLSEAYGGLNKEKIKDVAETLYLKALYAGDFLKSMGSNTIEIVKNTGAWIANKAQLFAQKAGLIALKGVQLVSQGVTSALTTAQWALNAAFIASPVGWVVLGIMALVAAGILLYKNWDTVKEKAIALREKVQEVFGGITGFISEAFSSARETVSGIIEDIRTTIEDVFSSVKDTVGGVVADILEFIQPILDKVNDLIEKITENKFVKGIAEFFNGGKGTLEFKDGEDSSVLLRKATGTPYFKGGFTHINEGGRGEIVNLPNGTQIIPHDIARRQSSQPIVNVSVKVQGNVIGNDEYANYIGNVVARRVVAAYGNM